MGEEYKNEWLDMMKLSLPDYHKARRDYSSRLWDGTKFGFDDD